MKRREFIALAVGAAAWPLAARAQPVIPVIGYFSGRSHDAEAAIHVPFLKALEGLGFAPGRNIAIEYRFAEGRDERLPELAAELVRRQVAILVATDRPSATAAKAATATIPIVFASGSDPVRMGFAVSFNRPGGNATGVSILTAELGPKRLALVRELLPKPGTIAFVVNKNAASTPFQIQEMQASAQAVGQPLLVVSVGTWLLADREISRFPHKKRTHMPGSSTTPGRRGARAAAPSVLPSTKRTVSAPEM